MKIGKVGEMKSKQLGFEFHRGPIGEQTKLEIGNKKPIDYGIHNDHSDYQARVGYLTQYIYLFPTESGRLWLEENKEVEIKTASQEGTTRVTGWGFPAPISNINGLIDILIPISIYKEFPIHRNTSTSIKGKMAVSIVSAMLEAGLIPLPLASREISDFNLQILGHDIIVNTDLKIQVKCDFIAGHKQKGGSGNIFLQIAECNPFKRY